MAGTLPYKVGVIKPSTRPGKAEELAAILPEGIVMEHANLSIAAGTRAELEQAIGDYDAKIREMVALGVDLVHCAGVPPLLLGYEGEQALVGRWESQYGKPVFTNGQSQVNAMRAFGARRIVGMSYFPGDINRDFARYLKEAGFEVLGMTGMDVPFQEVPRTPPEQVRVFLEACFDRHRGAEAVYLLGPAWRTLGQLDALEARFGVPVIHHIPAQSWEMQRRAGFSVPVQDHGRLVREMPPFVAPPA